MAGRRTATCNLAYSALASLRMGKQRLSRGRNQLITQGRPGVLISIAGKKGALKQQKSWRNRKDRDIGYALAANSCEGAISVDTCTVAVLDAITAFAVPNPGVSSQSRRFFRVWPSSELPRPTNHPAYFGLAAIFEANLSAVDISEAI